MAFAFSTCQDDDFSDVPALLGAAAVPAVLASCWGEVQAAKRMHPVSLHTLGPYKVRGRTFPFRLWLAGLLAISFAINFEVFTSGVFAGRVIHTATQCQSSSRVPDMWRRAASFGILRGACPSLGVVCFLAWLGMPLEALFGVLLSVPKRGPDVSTPDAFSFRELIRLREPVEPRGFLITAFDDHVVVSSAIQTLSEVGRMQLLGFRLRDMEQRFKKGRVSSTANVRRGLAGEILRDAVRAALTLLFTAAMSNLQTSVLEISSAASRSLDRRAAGTISLTMVLFLYKLRKYGAALVTDFCLFWPHRNACESACSDFEGEDERQPERNQRRVILAGVIFSTSAACSLGLMAWSCSKLIVGTLACESWVYTWSGCLPLDALPSARGSS